MWFYEPAWVLRRPYENPLTRAQEKIASMTAGFIANTGLLEGLDLCEVIQTMRTTCTWVGKSSTQLHLPVQKYSTNP